MGLGSWWGEGAGKWLRLQMVMTQRQMACQADYSPGCLLINMTSDVISALPEEAFQEKEKKKQHD